MKAILICSIALLTLPGDAYAQTWWKQAPSTPATTTAPVKDEVVVAPSNPAAPQENQLQSQAQSQAPAQTSIVLIPGDISKPYDILGNVEAEVKGRDSEDEVKAAIQAKAVAAYGSQANAIIHYKAEMRVTNILAGYGLKGGFKWIATGIAVKFK